MITLNTIMKLRADSSGFYTITLNTISKLRADNLVSHNPIERCTGSSTGLT